MNSVIHLGVFQDRFVSGLIFSMLEGLNDGKSIKFVSSSPLDDFRLQLEGAKIEGINLEPIKKEKSHWEITVSRKKVGQGHECCGICGGMEKSS